MVAAELDSAELGKAAVAEMLKRHILINCTSDTVLRFLRRTYWSAHTWIPRSRRLTKSLPNMQRRIGSGAAASAGGQQHG